VLFFDSLNEEIKRQIMRDGKVIYAKPLSWAQCSRVCVEHDGTQKCSLGVLFSGALPFSAKNIHE
jgi:hypothetical protein